MWGLVRSASVLLVLLFGSGRPHCAQAADAVILLDFVRPYGATFFTPFLSLLGLADSSLVVLVQVPPGGGLAPGGLAVDDAGNIYVSDYGAGAADGRILMQPADGRSPVEVFRGLAKPSDVEMSPDGRALIIAGPDGAIYRKYFGVSVRCIFASEAPGDPVAFLRTDRGTLAARLDADGYFTFPEVLMPWQASWTVDLVILNGPTTHLFPDLRLQRGAGGFTGQTLLDITL